MIHYKNYMIKLFCLGPLLFDMTHLSNFTCGPNSLIFLAQQNTSTKSLSIEK